MNKSVALGSAGASIRTYAQPLTSVFLAPIFFSHFSVTMLLLPQGETQTHAKQCAVLSSSKRSKNGDDKNNAGGGVADKGEGEIKAERKLTNDGLIPHFLASQLKPHQVEGIEFMWKHVAAGNPGGCILAHSMGLGKSLQVCTLIHAFCKRQMAPKYRKDDPDSSARVMLVVPSSLLDNWMSEFKKWVNKGGKPEIKVMILSPHTTPSQDSKLRLLRQWDANREGVLIIGYETFSTLSKKYKVGWKKDLLNKSADLIVLDEGHRIKSSKSNIAVALAEVKTKRRIILTGTPLQNNLEEYWEMVNFVKPKLMWTKKHFRENWDGPIKLAMLSDAEDWEVRKGKRMMFRLTKRLAPYVQRKDESILAALLPPKEELVVYIRSSDEQLALYNALMAHHSSICERANGEQACKCKHLLPFHAASQKIVNHPDALHPNWVAWAKKVAHDEKLAATNASVRAAAGGLLSPDGSNICSQTPATTLAQPQECGGEYVDGTPIVRIQKKLMTEMQSPAKGVFACNMPCVCVVFFELPFAWLK